MNETEFKVHDFLEYYLLPAIDDIAEKYYQVPVLVNSRKTRVTHPERVFCYELYHQLRKKLGDTFEFDLHGELPKSNRMFFRKHKIPDLIIHSAGSMAKNQLVVEVKSGLDKRGIEKDVETLTQFLIFSDYHNAILLIYGHKQDEIEKEISNWFKNIVSKDDLSKNMKKIMVVIKESSKTDCQIISIGDILNTKKGENG